MSYRNNFNEVAGAGKRCRNNVAGEIGRRCECVFECLLELLEEAGENNNKCCHREHNSVSPGGENESLRRRCDCECVFECLIELLEDALEEEDDCRHHR